MKSILRLLLLCCALAAGCAPAPAPYTADETTHLDRREPAPFSGWLVSDADMEWLLKQAASAEDAP